VGIVLPDSDYVFTAAAQEEAAIGHWRRTLGRHIWFLRRAGIPSTDIEREVTRRLRQCLKVRKLRVSASDERISARIMAQWRHDCGYLDTQGCPLTLRFDGRSPTFRSLVRAAVPGVDASMALAAMKGFHLVSHHTRGSIRLIADGVSSRGAQRGALLKATHAALEALTDTCYANLNTRPALDGSSRVQQMTYTEYLDPRSVQAYEEFLNESAQVFLAMHESWLKRHEAKSHDRQRKPLNRVGVGVFALRGR
jgi:hypothetical protein